MNRKESDYLLVKKVNIEKEAIFLKLRENGFRITNQRKLIIDTIFNKECTSCKEIYWEASKKDSSIGIATVYRIIKSLEEIGAINRKNLYKISSEEIDILNGEGIVVLKNKKTFKLSEEDWKRIIRIGLYEAEGLNINDIDSIVIKKVNDGEEEIM